MDKSENPLELFNLISRPSIHEMVILHRKWYNHHIATNNQYPSTQNLVFVRKYGWGWIEYLQAKKEAGYSY